MLNNVEQCTSVATGCHQVATVHIGRSCVGILRSPARNLRSRHLRNGESLILAPLWYGAAPKGQDSTFIRLLCVQDCSGKAVRPYQASCRSKGICEIEGCISCISCIDIVVFVVLMVTHCYVTPCHTASYTKVLSLWRGTRLWKEGTSSRPCTCGMDLKWFEHGNWNNIEPLNIFEHSVHCSFCLLSWVCCGIVDLRQSALWLIGGPPLTVYDWKSKMAGR
jgi:hypothetical protein